MKIILIALILLLQGCSNNKPEIHTETILAFGTLIDVSIYGESFEKRQQVMDVLREQFKEMHQQWHAWHPGVLGEVNKKLSSGQIFETEDSVLSLIKLGKHLSEISSGLFNPAIGRLIKLWGFQQDEETFQLPSKTEIQRMVADKPSMQDIHINGKKLSCSNPAVRLDFGGFAKGYGIDRAIEILLQAGIKNAVINAGGDLRAIGQPGDRPWRVGIRHPRKQGTIATLEVSGDESVFTSGDYERVFYVDGVRYPHIIDPRTGYPATSSASVTVITKDATLADAAATALFVAGPENWREISASMGIDNVLLISAQGEKHLSDSMKKRLQFKQ